LHSLCLVLIGNTEGSSFQYWQHPICSVDIFLVEIFTIWQEIKLLFLKLFWSRSMNNPERDHLTDAEILAAGTFIKQHDVWYTVTQHVGLLHLVLHLVHERGACGWASRAGG